MEVASVPLQGVTEVRTKEKACDDTSLLANSGDALTTDVAGDADADGIRQTIQHPVEHVAKHRGAMSFPVQTGFMSSAKSSFFHHDFLCSSGQSL